jgi:hypothetical protein
VIPKPLIGIESIRVIPFGFGRSIHNLLQGCLATNPDHCPAQNTTGLAIYQSENVNFVFLSQMNVNILSSSASFTSLGCVTFSLLKMPLDNGILIMGYLDMY